MTRARALVMALSLLVLAVGIVVGVAVAGSGTGTVPVQMSSTRAGTMTAGVTGSVSTTGPAVTVMTQPVVTSVLPPTRPPSSLPGYRRPPVTVGDMNTPQQFVIGALYVQALRAQGYAVSITRNVGTTDGLHAEAQEALRQGLLSVYPQYLDVWDRTVARRRQAFTTVARAYLAGAQFAQKHGFRLLEPARGGNRFGFAVTTQFAQENHLHSLSQLSRMGVALSFGVPLRFTGLTAAQRAYGFKAGVVQNVDTGMQYQALASGTVQVAYAQSADPELAQPGFTLLSDPKHVFGYGNIVPVTTPKVIRAEGPAFARAIERVDAQLSTGALRGLTQELLVEHDGLGPIGNTFLQGIGVLPTPRYATVPQSPAKTVSGRSSQSPRSRAQTH